MNSQKLRLVGRRAGLSAAAILLVFGAAGCNNAGEGAVSGAGLGALTGLAIGAVAGHAGSGALIGTAAGALGGAIIGDQNQRHSQDRYYEYDRHDRRYDP